MNSLVIAIIGNPGSGKSSLMRKLKKKLPNFKQIDDIYRTSKGIKLAKKLVSEKKDLIVSDIVLTKKEERIKLVEKLGCPVVWMFFENNPINCTINVINRKRDSFLREIELIKELSKDYAPPEGAIPVVNAISKKYVHR